MKINEEKMSLFLKLLKIKFLDEYKIKLDDEYDNETQSIIEECYDDLSYEYLMMISSEGEDKKRHKENLIYIKQTLNHIKNREEYNWYLNMFRVAGTVIGVIGISAVKAFSNSLAPISIRAISS